MLSNFVVSKANDIHLIFHITNTKTIMSDTKIFSIPDNNGGNGNGALGNGIVPFILGAGMSGGLGGFGFGGGGYGWNAMNMNNITELFAMGILARMFGWNNGGLGGDGAGGAAFLSSQINGNNGRDLIMQAVTSQGEQSRTATQTLSTMLGQDFNLVNSGIQLIQSSLSQIAAQQGLTPLQIINAIQSGNAALSQQLCQCCCDNKFAIAEQTSQLQQGMNAGFNGVERGISGVQTQMAINQGRDDLNVCQQTYALTDSGNRNTQAILAKLGEMQTQTLQDKLDAERDKNTALKGEISQLNQNQYIAGVVGQSLAPINGALAALNKEVDDIKCKLPATVNVQYPNLVAVNATPYVSGGIYPNGVFGGYGYGNGNFGF